MTINWTVHPDPDSFRVRIGDCVPCGEPAGFAVETDTGWDAWFPWERDIERDFSDFAAVDSAIRDFHRNHCPAARQQDIAMREAAADEEWEQGSRFCGSIRNRQMRDSHFATA